MLEQVYLFFLVWCPIVDHYNELSSTKECRKEKTFKNQNTVSKDKQRASEAMHYKAKGVCFNTTCIFNVAQGMFV